MKAEDVVSAIENITEVIYDVATKLNNVISKNKDDAEVIAASIVHSIIGGWTEENKASLDAVVKSLHARIQAPLPEATDDDV